MSIVLSRSGVPNVAVPVLAMLCIQWAHAAGSTTPPGIASGPLPNASAEQIRKTLSPYPKGSTKKVLSTPLGEVLLIGDAAGGGPETAVLNGEVLVASRRATNGYPYRLHDVDFDGRKDPKTGKFLITRTVLGQHATVGHGCQYILLDFTGSKVWVSQAFPSGKSYPGWVDEGDRASCFNMTWVEWRQPYSFFYFEGPVAGAVFAHNPKLQAVVGPIDSDDAPPHPECKSLVPQPVGAIAECEAAARERGAKKAGVKSSAKTPS